MKKLTEFAARWKRIGGWRALVPAREDWLDQADGVGIVLVNVLCFALGGSWISVVGLAVFTLAVLHFRMLDRKLIREREVMLTEALKMLDQYAVAVKTRDIVMRMPKGALWAGTRRVN